MVARTVVCTLFLSIGLLGCASAQHPGAGSPKAFAKATQATCDGTPSKACVVNVDVVCPATGPCTLSVDTEFVIVSKKAKLDIVWELRTANYKFVADTGIEIDASAGNFDKCKYKEENRKVECRNNHANAALTVYKYAIRVIDPTGARWVEPLDPWIIND